MSATGELLRRGAALLAGTETPALDAKVLLLGAAPWLTETDIAARPESPVSRRAERRFLKLVERRRRGAPLAYLTGVREFWSLPVGVRPGVLIPRPETEGVVETVLELTAADAAGAVVVDLGTGSGAIALAVAGERPGARLIAADASRRALRTARRNARRLGRPNIEFLRGDLFAPLAKRGLQGGCDLIASNPPYLSAADWDELAPGVRDYEPKSALLAGPTGLEAVERIVAGAPTFLKPGGWLVLEIGAGQAERVLKLFGAGWKSADVRPDLAGIPRVVKGQIR